MTTQPDEEALITITFCPIRATPFVFGVLDSLHAYETLNHASTKSVEQLTKHIVAGNVHVRLANNHEIEVLSSSGNGDLYVATNQTCTCPAGASRASGKRTKEGVLVTCWHIQLSRLLAFIRPMIGTVSPALLYIMLSDNQGQSPVTHLRTPESGEKSKDGQSVAIRQTIAVRDAGTVLAA